MSKISMIAAGAVGYVLGARAGRERYEQIAKQASRVWSSPTVQKASRDAKDMAREKAPVVGEKLAGAAKSAASAASSAVSSDDSGKHTSATTPATTPATAPSATPVPPPGI